MTSKRWRGRGGRDAGTNAAPSPGIAWWVIGAARLVLALLVWLLGPILSPFLFGAILAYIGSPMVSWCARHRIPRVVGALLVVALMVAVLVALVLILAPMVQTEAATIARRLPDLVDRDQRRRAYPGCRSQFGIDLQFDAASVRAFVADNVSGVQNVGVWLLGSLKIGGVVAARIFANLLLTPVVMFYLLTDWGHWCAGSARPVAASLGSLVAADRERSRQRARRVSARTSHGDGTPRGVLCRRVVACRTAVRDTDRRADRRY